MEEFAAIIDNLTDNARASLIASDACAQMMNREYIGAEHLLVGLLAQERSTANKILAEDGVTLEAIESKLGIVRRKIDIRSGGRMLNEEARIAFEASWRFANDNQQDYLGTEHLLFGLLVQSESIVAALLTEMGVAVGRLRERVHDLVLQRATIKAGGRKATLRIGKKRNLLEQFGVDLTARATLGELDPVIGRAGQIERLATILSRRNKSNPILIGEPGVGKTAVVEALAQQIVKGNVPLNLLGARIIQIDLAGMIAGTKYRGEFEERLKRVIDELASDEKRIGFIDEMHLLMGAGASEGSMDAANILKPALARGQIRLIGATTYEEYRRFIQKDQALDRRFQTIEIDEPSLDDTVKIIKGLRKSYERHHRVILGDEVIKQAVTLADKYVTDRFMPDKALDLIDEAAALKRVRHNKISPEMKQSLYEINKLEAELDKAVEREEYDHASQIKTKLVELEKQFEKTQGELVKQTISNLEVADVARVVALRTGVPVQQLTKSQKKLILDLEKNLGKYIIGQKTAISEVAKAIRRSRSGIGDGKRPIGSFIFLGPSGVGKTELAKVLAREVFGSEEALLKIDMSEFSERHSLSKLLGAPAGYVGYDDSAKLTDAIRRRPYQVVLFDEIEKADSDIYNILLQILDDGYLTDARGQRVNFRNTIVILTSNLGTEQIAEQSSKRAYGFGEQSIGVVDNKKLAVEALDKFMPIELVNRFDDVVVFNSLSEADARKIMDLMLADFSKRLAEKRLQLEVDSSVKKMLLKKGFDDKKGARLLRRTIEEKIENQIADALLADKITSGDRVRLSFKNQKLEMRTYALNK